MENDKVDFYINRIMFHVTNWIKRLNLKEDSKYPVKECHIDELRKKLHLPIEKLIEVNRDYLLTEVFCYYLVYESFDIFDYRWELTESLYRIIRAYDDELIPILNNYVSHVCFGDRYKYDHQVDYVKLMTEEELDMFNTCINCVDRMYQVTEKADETFILKEILFNIYAYCIINNQKDKFKDFASKYFEDPRRTIDHFINNGFLEPYHTLADGFNDYIYEDMNNKGSRPIIQ